jgi:hypothetical protein
MGYLGITGAMNTTPAAAVGVLLELPIYILFLRQRPL